MASREYSHSQKAKSRQRHQVIVNPEQASDTGPIWNMLGYFQEYISQGYSNKKEEKRETVLWAQLENAEDYGIAVDSSVGMEESAQPLLLLLGLSTGYSLWTITYGGEARRVCSVCEEGGGAGKIVRLLKLPNHESDQYKEHRPIVAVVNKNSQSNDSSSTLVFISLKNTNKDQCSAPLEVKKLRFEKKTILGVCSNQKVVVVQLPKRVVVLNAGSFEQNYTIKNYEQSLPQPWSNPVALGSHWLAVTSNKLDTRLMSQGGTPGVLSGPVTSAVVNTVKKGLAALTDTISGLTARVQHGGNESVSASTETSLSLAALSILDVDYPHTGEVHLDQNVYGDGVVAHFLVHANSGIYITALCFNNSGELLFCADSEGQWFHVFRIQASAQGTSRAVVQHLYALHRGSTTAQVQDVCFSNDSRWVTVSTLNGTTHLFPISPYGGDITVRTHTSSRVVNQHSRFHTSAGIHSQPHHHQALSPPTTFSLPSSAAGPLEYHSLTRASHSLLVADSSDMLTHSHPVTVYPLLQIKQPYLPPTGGIMASSTSDEGAPDNTPVCLRAVFAVPLLNATSSPVDTQEQGVVYRLSVLGACGVLTEHCIVPQKLSSANDGDDAPIEVAHTPHLCWKLLCSSQDIVPSFTPVDEAYLLAQTNNHSAISISLPVESVGKGEWLSQVETLTHAPPTRRLWMGPQFSFRTVTNKKHTPNHLGEEEEEEGDTAVLSPTHNLSDLLDVCDLHTYTTPLNATERDGYTDQAVNSAGVEVFGSWKDIAPRLKSSQRDTDLQQQLMDAMSESRVDRKDGLLANSW